MKLFFGKLGSVGLFRTELNMDIKVIIGRHHRYLNHRPLLTDFTLKPKKERNKFN